MKQHLLLGMAVCGVALSSFQTNAFESHEIYYFDANKVILPDVYHSKTAWDADVWVVTGERYTDPMNESNPLYNRIVGVPAQDEDGRDWFDPAYELTINDDLGIDWESATAPFSNDEYYNELPSFRWTENNLMAEIYIRRSFTLDEPLGDDHLILAAGHDDAPAEYYINGVKVFEVNDGWNNGLVVVLDDEYKSLIKTDGSENIMAVHVHQNWGGAYADCGLYYAYTEIEATILPSAKEEEYWPCEYFFPVDNEDLVAWEEVDKWYTVDFEFDEWQDGYGPLTNDIKDGECVWNNHPATYWQGQESPIMVRRHLELTAEDVAEIKAAGRVQLCCSYDEDPRVFLNGEFIWDASGWNDNNYATYDLTEDQVNLFTEGDNLICVSLRQGGGGSHIDFGMKLINEYKSGISAVDADSKTIVNDNRIFDLQGRYVGTDLNKLGRGLYIQGGKKVLVNK